MKKLISLALLATTIIVSASAPASSAPKPKQIFRILKIVRTGATEALATIGTAAGVYAVGVDCRNAYVHNSKAPLTSAQVNALIQQACKRR